MCDRQEHLSSVIKDAECLRAHQLLSACMTENHRDWTKCQAQVKLLRRCQEQGAAVVAVDNKEEENSGAGARTTNAVNNADVTKSNP